MRAGLNILVAGGTQAGKTTMLNCLAAAIPGGERVVSRRGGLRAALPPPRLGADADPAVRARGHRRDHAARPGQGEPADAAEPDHRRRGAGRGVPRPAARAQRRAARHVHDPRQQRPRGAGQDVHAAAAGRREHLGPVRRPDRRDVGRPRRPPRHRPVRRPPGQRDRRRPRAGSRTTSSRPSRSSSAPPASCAGRGGMPPRRELYERVGIDVQPILGESG